MTISVLTAWFNEADLAPYFLDHYSWADEIVILLEAETMDRSREIISKYPMARIEECESPGGLLDDGHLIELKNNRVRAFNTDWVISVDADEFVLIPRGKEMHGILATADGNLARLHLWQVWRNARDADLNPGLPAVWQRRHGDPNRSRGLNACYRKPVIVKPEAGIEWYPGQHIYRPGGNARLSDLVFDGAHWSMADAEIAIRRRIAGRRDRMSAANRANCWGYQWFNVTEDQIRADCEAHLHDPRLF